MRKLLKEMTLMIGICLLLIVGLIFITSLNPTRAERKKYINLVDNERDYEFYIDQLTTGSHGSVNCVPSSIVMAGLWQNEHFEPSVLELRDEYKPEGGGWSRYLTFQALTNEGIEFTKHYNNEVDKLLNFINNGNVIIVALDITFVSPKDDDNSAIGRFYRPSYTDTFHCILLKGTVTLENEQYFIVHDPWNSANYYKDNSPKGKNRLYPVEEIVKGIKDYGYDIFVIRDNSKSD